MRNDGEEAKLKAVVFDMDGVLFDTERLCMEGWNVVAKEQGVIGMEEVSLQCIGRNAADTRAYVLENMGEDFPYDAFRTRVSEWFWEEIAEKGLPIKPGVYELLEYLKEQGFGIGLASSTRRESVEAHLKEAGIEAYFSALVTGDMVTHSKPEPEIFLLACEKLGVEPCEAYAIEDSPNGIRSAYSAGMKPVMVPDLIAPDAEMKEKSFLICQDLNVFREYLKR